MSRRTLAIVISVPLMVALWIAAAMVPVPYVTFSPGVTVDVLSEVGGQERIQVQGHDTYYDGGELRMTTVSVTTAENKVSLFSALSAWISDERAVQPYDAYYEEGTTNEENDIESSVQMVSSQDAAIAAALRALDYDLKPTVEIFHVNQDSPADGKLGVRDRILRVNGKDINGDVSLVAKQVKAAGTDPVTFTVIRDKKRSTVKVAPEKVDGKPMVGITSGPSFVFPFQVAVNIDPRIGGPSAGLMFSLAIFDTLTKGSLTGGHRIAGTGTIDADGKVGPIGGIQQKIPAARKAGSELFLVPPDNCEEALGGANGDMRLVRADTLEAARTAIETWVKDPKAKLPSCKDVK